VKKIKNNPTVVVIGLGYVGLPLAIQFSTKYTVIGFDHNSERITELRAGLDRTGEISRDRLDRARTAISFTYDPAEITNQEVYIVAVPTPITSNKIPDLRPLTNASQVVGKAIKNSTVKPTIIFESTVYPGCTEEYCVPIVEHESGMGINNDFFVGYSPERINPGDTVHTIEKITKVISGSTEEATDIIEYLYTSVVDAGTFRASSIQVAEAAKVIENTQRDLNIALVNELAMIFSRLRIDTTEVLEAASTKWNFLPFRPGLVGGHCIGVDPYYLTFKAQETGYHPEVILAGRRLNDSMGFYVASEMVKMMIKKGVAIAESRVLILGITFKENCSDIRNTRVIDVLKELRDYGCITSVYDPWASPEEIKREFGIELLETTEGIPLFDGVVLAVGHRQFLPINPRELVHEQGTVYDVKSIWPKELVDRRL